MSNIKYFAIELPDGGVIDTKMSFPLKVVEGEIAPLAIHDGEGYIIAEISQRNRNFWENVIDLLNRIEDYSITCV